MVTGDIIEITCNHPDEGSFVFYPKAGEASKYDLGGFVSEDDKNSLDGSGEMIDKMKQGRWRFEIPIAWDMNERQDLESLNLLQNSPKLGDWTFTHINGTVYNGKGKPVGELSGDGATGMATLIVSGGGVLKQL